MRNAFAPEDILFQREVREWIAAHYPDSVRAKIARSPHGRADREDHVRWQQALYEKGWLVPYWPTEYGGKGWSNDRLYLFQVVMAEENVPDLPGSGVELLAPVLLRFGTPAQKAKYLDDLLAARTWWTQGFSEPNAGSDLASLQTRADRNGDHYVVNGSKIWTTNAHRADMMFALVRTSRGKRKQEGISFLLINMKAPGVTVRPILTLDEAPPGYHEVNEVFFQDVEVPLDECLGPEGGGWECAKYLLEFERARPVVAAIGLQHKLRKFASLLQVSSNSDPAACRRSWQLQFAQLAVDIEALVWTERQLHARVNKGKSPGQSGSLIKTLETEYDQRLMQLMLEYGGLEALPLIQPFEQSRDGVSPEVTIAAAAYFNSRKRSIYAGTNEIQRNIIAKHMLGLP